MNPLLRRLSILRLKVRLLDGWKGVCALIALVLAVVIGVGFADYWIHLPTLVRAAALVGLLVGSAGLIYRYLIRPFTRACDSLHLALRIEEEHPELNDALATTVQFLSLSDEERARLGASESMRARTVAQTLERAERVDFGCILDRRAGVLFGVAALSALCLAGWLGVYHRTSARTALLRFLEPFGLHTWTQVAVHRSAPAEAIDGENILKWEPLDPSEIKPDHIAIGRPYRIKVFLSGQIPKQARVEILGKIRSDLSIPKLVPGEDGQSAYFVAQINMTQHYHKFRFRVVANDGAFPPRPGAWHEVAVMHKPKLIDLDGQPSPQITVYPPAYTDLPSPSPLLPGVKHLEVYAGSRAVFRAKADRPLVEAHIRYEPEDRALWEAAQFLGGAIVPHKIHAEFDAADKSVFSIPLAPWISGRYVLYLRDEFGLESEEPAELRVLKDPVPIVQLIRPAASGEFAPDAVVPFKFLVSDEKFAVKSVYLDFKRKAVDGRDLDDDATRSVLYDSQSQGKLIPFQLAQLFRAPKLLPDLRLRDTKLNFDMNWSLKGHKFKEGQVVVVEIFADDFCDIDPGRQPGRSHQIELRIVSKREIIARADEKLGQIQKELEKAAKLEQKALDTVREIAKADKVDQPLKDKLTDGADVPQRDVRDIVGKGPEDGIRGELQKLKQTLKANNLEDTRVFKEAKDLQGALNGIAQEELQQIEPKLNEIRNDFAHSDKNDPKTKTKLEQTAKQQDTVVKTLNELIGKMDPGAKMREQRVELREIIGKQQQLRDELQDLAAKKKETMAAAEPKFKDVVEKDFKNKLQQKAEEQKQLAERLEKLMKEMKAEAKQQEKLGKKEEANKLNEAIKQLEQQKPKQEEKKEQELKQLLPLNGQMKQVAKELADKSEAPQKAIDQQQKIAEAMENALKAMEGRDQNIAREEIKEREQMTKEIDKLNQELKNLKDQQRKIEELKDMQERLKRKQEMADKLGELQEKIEKMRRQAARLQEQQAANELKEAAKEIEKAAQKAQQGENADPEQKRAEQHLKQAKNDIKDSEEELAREILIKMADQLKGLKERQDASLKRSEALHPKVMKKKSWTDALLDSLDGNIDAQKEIADETDTFKDKLKEAVVFSGVLERAKKAMDDAGKVMDSRRTEGKDRRYEEDGKQMDEMELKEENEMQSDTIRHQKQAARSLTNLLDSLKEEIDKKKPKQDVAQEKPQEPKENEEAKQPKGGIPNQDGIPSTAQLKVLKAEQMDLNERTIDFDKRYPDLDPQKLTDRQRDELRQLEEDQRRIEDLFQRLTAPPQKEGDQP